MISDLPCPVCGAAPGEICTTTLGRPVTDHRARTRRANRAPLTFGADNSQLTVTARCNRAAERRLVLTAELAKAREKYQQLQSVIEYLEGELA